MPLVERPHQPTPEWCHVQLKEVAGDWCYILTRDLGYGCKMLTGCKQSEATTERWAEMVRKIAPDGE